jgi:Homeodomain-like domain
MTKQERDRLVALKKAKKKLITQKQAASEIGVSERQVRRMLRNLKERGDRAVVPCYARQEVESKTCRRSEAKGNRDSEPRGVPRVRADTGSRIFSPETQAAGEPGNGAYMDESKPCSSVPNRSGSRRYIWRTRRRRWGELVQCDTSEHAWLEGRGPKLYLISMIDDATSR